MACPVCLINIKSIYGSAKNNHIEQCFTRIAWTRYKLGSGEKPKYGVFSGVYCKYCLSVCFKTKNEAFCKHEEECSLKLYITRLKLGNKDHLKQIKTLAINMQKEEDFLKLIFWIRNFCRGRFAREIREGNKGSIKIFDEIRNVYYKNVPEKFKRFVLTGLYDVKDEFTEMF